MHKPIVLLTATINCEGVPITKRLDPKIREADYLWALKGWLGVDDYASLIFCENSGADLTNIEKAANEHNQFGHKLTFLSCNKNSEAATRGKGFGEMEIIRHAIDSVPELTPEQTIVKVTGRYRARNGTNLMRRFAETDVDISCIFHENLTFADSVLFGITVDCAEKHLLSRQNQLDDINGVFFEHILAAAVHSTLLAGGKWSPLPYEPSLYGVSGSTGAPIGTSPITRIRNTARHRLTQLIY